MEIRKIILTRETIYAEAGRAASRPINRVVGIAVIENPFAGRFVEDLSPLFDIGAQFFFRAAFRLNRSVEKRDLQFAVSINFGGKIKVRFAQNLAGNDIADTDQITT